VNGRLLRDTRELEGPETWPEELLLRLSNPPRRVPPVRDSDGRAGAAVDSPLPVRQTGGGRRCSGEAQVASVGNERFRAAGASCTGWYIHIWLCR